MQRDRHRLSHGERVRIVKEFERAGVFGADEAGRPRGAPAHIEHMLRRYARVFFGDRARAEIRRLDTRTFRMAARRARRVLVGSGL